MQSRLLFPMTQLSLTKAIDGDKVENRAWVNDSEKDIVDGPVIDPDVRLQVELNKSLHSSRNRPDGEQQQVLCDRDR